MRTRGVIYSGPGEQPAIQDLTIELWPFLISIIAVLILITYAPAMVTFLPSLLIR